LADEVAAVIATALTSPRRLGLPFAAWTLDRLVAYLREQRGEEQVVAKPGPGEPGVDALDEAGEQADGPLWRRRGVSGEGQELIPRTPVAAP
jgi:hypothetical protein